MCRFLVYVGHEQPIVMADLLTRSDRSIIKQSYDSRERAPEAPMSAALNGDGFGVGWYEGSLGNDENNADLSTVRVPCVFTSISPAWNNQNLHRLADKIGTPLLFAHVRAASPGSPTNEANCHPFQHGRYMFMHNGGISGFSKMKRRLLNMLDEEVFNLIEGTTDSEHCFALFLNVLYQKSKATPTPNVMSSPPMSHRDGRDVPFKDFLFANSRPEDIRDSLIETCQLLDEWTRDAVGASAPSLMNFAVTNGEVCVVTRVSTAHFPAASLYFASGTSFADMGQGQYRMKQDDRRQLCHVITSEPVTDDVYDWIEVPRNHMVMITRHTELLLYAVPISQ